MVHPNVGISETEVAACSEPLLHLHLIAGGKVRLRCAPLLDEAISAPAIVVCRADIAHVLRAEPDRADVSTMHVKAFLDGPVASLFLEEFAAPCVVSLEGADSSMNYIVGLMCSKLADPRCGQPALLNRAGDILFIGLLRHLVAHPRTTEGLFNGLTDARIARALVAMHTAPQKSWTLDRLAEEAGMSRTAFANRFREIMQMPPGKYLGKLRLSIASRSIELGLGLKRAARDSGYRSTSALSRALSRAGTPALTASGISMVRIGCSTFADATARIRPTPG